MFPIREKKKKKADSQIIIDPSILRYKLAKTCLIFSNAISLHIENSSPVVEGFKLMCKTHCSHCFMVSSSDWLAEDLESTGHVYLFLVSQ